LNSLPENKEEDYMTSTRGKVPRQGALFYAMFASFEEEFGLITHSMRIYDRALKDIKDQENQF